MAFANPGRPLATADAGTRVEYLQKVLLWTTGGLLIAGVVGALTALALGMALSAGITFPMSRVGMLVGILGSYAVAHFVARGMVFGRAKVAGFLLGSTFEGISMGWLLLTAVLLGTQSGDPFGLIGLALGLTFLTAGGMTAYVWTKPREFKLLGAALSALFIPMLILMGVGFVFPGLFGGPVGLLVAVAFVAISAGGLLYQINAVVHRLHTHQHIEGAYLVTMAVLILFWNVLSLLMRLNRR